MEIDGTGDDDETEDEYQDKDIDMEMDGMKNGDKKGDNTDASDAKEMESQETDDDNDNDNDNDIIIDSNENNNINNNNNNNENASSGEMDMVDANNDEDATESDDGFLGSKYGVLSETEPINDENNSNVANRQERAFTEQPKVNKNVKSKKIGKKPSKSSLKSQSAPVVASGNKKAKNSSKSKSEPKAKAKGKTKGKIGATKKTATKKDKSENGRKRRKKERDPLAKDLDYEEEVLGLFKACNKSYKNNNVMNGNGGRSIRVKRGGTVLYKSKKFNNQIVDGWISDICYDSRYDDYWYNRDHTELQQKEKDAIKHSQIAVSISYQMHVETGNGKNTSIKVYTESDFLNSKRLALLDREQMLRLNWLKNNIVDE